MQANARPGITKEHSTFAKELFIGIITTIIGTVLGVWLEYSFNVTDYMPSSKTQIVSIEPVDGSVRPLPLQEEIVVNYVTKRKDETVRVLLNGIDITREATEHSQGRMVFRGTSCTSIANLTPTVHYLSAEIVNGNDRVVASKTASLTTTFQDLFDNFDPRVWREQSGQWTANGGYLTGSPQEGAATASLLSVGEYLHDIRIVFLTRLFDQYYTTLRDQIKDLYHRKRIHLPDKIRRKKEEALHSGQRAATLHWQSFYPPKDTMIVVFLGSSVNEYRALSLTFLEDITPLCPVCGSYCHFHGWYQRKVRDDDGAGHILVPRVKCVHCKKTHIILPDFLAPHKQYIQHVREATVQAGVEEKTPVEKIPGPQAVATSQRWIREFRSIASSLAGALISVRTRLCPQITDSLLSPIAPTVSGLLSLCKDICKILGIQIRYSTVLGLVNQILSSDSMQIWC